MSGNRERGDLRVEGRETKCVHGFQEEQCKPDFFENESKGNVRREKRMRSTHFHENQGRDLIGSYDSLWTYLKICWGARERLDVYAPLLWVEMESLKGTLLAQ